MVDLLKNCIPDLTDEACDKFVAYYRLLIDWNERINLTAITEPEEVREEIGSGGARVPQ